MRAILDDLHGFIAYGELILGELASDPYCFAPPRSIIRLEDWLFYLARRVFPGLVAFQTTGSKIPVKPPDFSHGPALSMVLLHIDQAAINSRLGPLNRSIEQYDHLSPLRPDTRPTGPHIGRFVEIESVDEAKAPSPPSEVEYDLWLSTRGGLEQEIVQNFDALLEPFRSFERLLAGRLSSEAGGDTELIGSEGRRAQGDSGGIAPRSHASPYSPGLTDDYDAKGPVGGADPRPYMGNDGLTISVSPNLTPIGKEGKGKARTESGPGHRPDEEQEPHWDADSGELCFKGVVIRTVFPQAKRISVVLNTFQEDGWPEEIDNPLSGKPSTQSLRDVTDSLNDGLKMIRFRPAKNGKAVRWERREEQETP